MRASGLLIVADDLSGAADCAIAFAAAGRRTVVSLDASAPARPAAVLAIDTDTRRLAPACRSRTPKPGSSNMRGATPRCAR
ncbi:four-carbon acid sugar kinase family protein, partial [Burkholderia gladioli]|uniref:four-carbon acid sugar kinase family protein n=1 Tax=Burkholderia gladioli TaxID=28095 RepID=UPI002654F5A6